MESAMSNLDKRKKIIIFSGVLITMFLSAMDTTIVGTIMPKIVAELSGFNNYSWVFSIYMLAVVLSLSIFGKFSDIYGRKYFCFAGIVIFVTGSALCALSANMESLIIFRAIQGIGGGLLAGILPTIVGDLFSPAERPKYQGFLGGVYGLATIIGPIVGGLLTDAFSWRLSFYINIPIGLIAVIIILIFLPNTKTSLDKKPVDIFGGIVLVVLIVLLLATLSLAGDQFAWANPVIIGSFILFVLLLVIFIYAERKSKEPILPMYLFGNTIFNVSMIAGLVMGMIMYASTLFLPLFAQGVMGYGVAETGIIMFPLTIALVLANIISGIVVTRTGKYKKVTLASFILMAVGALILALNCGLQSMLALIVASCLLGAGMGISFPTFMNIAQNAVAYEYLGVASSSTQLSRNLGGIIGISLLTSLMNNSIWGTLQTKLAGITSEKFNIKELVNIQLLLDESRIGKLGNAISGVTNSIPAAIAKDFIQFLRDGLGSALAIVFYCMTASSIIIFIVILLFLKEIALRKQQF